MRQLCLDENEFQMIHIGVITMPKSELTKKYKKSFSHSYTLGPFPTFELLRKAPGKAICVYVHEQFNEKEKLEQLCAKQGVPCRYAPKTLETLSSKSACYAAAAFWKYSGSLDAKTSHIVLVNPSDMGNLGTILRTALSFGIHDVALIEPCADVFNPKTVRASMGALFSMRVELFESFSAYREAYGEDRDLFPFMLDGATVLSPEDCPVSPKYALVFGNEATGLPPEFQHCGKSLFIDQSDQVDSLNLSISVAIGAYIFTQKNKLPKKEETSCSG